MISEVKVWRLSPEQIEDYKLGQDLGDPHSIDRQELPRQHVYDQPKSRKGPKKKQLSKEQYERMRAKGIDDRTIATALGVGPTTLRKRKKEWGL